MQTFFLHLKYMDRMEIDIEGSPLNNLDEATEEARATIRDLAAIHLRSNSVFDLWSVQIADAEGNLLAEIFVSDTLRPVIPSAFLDVPPLEGPA